MVNWLVNGRRASSTISTGVCPQHLMVTATLCKPNGYHWTIMFKIFTGGTDCDVKKGRRNGLKDVSVH